MKITEKIFEISSKEFLMEFLKKLMKFLKNHIQSVVQSTICLELSVE
jgi:hypothetical protein